MLLRPAGAWGCKEVLGVPSSTLPTRSISVLRVAKQYHSCLDSSLPCAADESEILETTSDDCVEVSQNVHDVLQGYNQRSTALCKPASVTPPQQNFRSDESNYRDCHSYQGSLEQSSNHGLDFIIELLAHGIAPWKGGFRYVLY